MRANEHERIVIGASAELENEDLKRLKKIKPRKLVFFWTI